MRCHEATQVLRVPSSANLREQASRNTVTNYHLSHNITLYLLSFTYTFYLSDLIGSYRYLLPFSKPRHCPAHGCEESIQIFAIHILCGKPMSSESLAWSLRERWLHSEFTVNFRKWVQNSAQFSAPPSATRQHTVVFCICLQSVHILVVCWGSEWRTAPKTSSNQPQRENCGRPAYVESFHVGRRMSRNGCVIVVDLGANSLNFCLPSWANALMNLDVTWCN